MSLSEFILFLSITLVASASPGPVMLSCMSNGARYGIAKSLQGMLGASLGNIFLVGMSALGLGLIVHNSDVLFSIIKWLGALYLVYLGIVMIRQPVLDIYANDKMATRSRSLLLSAFFIAVSNPKGLIYFGALFPQFVHYDQPLVMQFALLTATFLITDLLWMLIYAAAGYKIMSWLKMPKHQTLFNTLSGFALIITGLLVAATGKN